MIDAGARPQLDKRNKTQLMLRSANSFARLSKNDGEPTKVGLF